MCAENKWQGFKDASSFGIKTLHGKKDRTHGSGIVDENYTWRGSLCPSRTSISGDMGSFIWQILQK